MSIDLSDLADLAEGDRSESLLFFSKSNNFNSYNSNTYFSIILKFYFIISS